LIKDNNAIRRWIKKTAGIKIPAGPRTTMDEQCRQPVPPTTLLIVDTVPVPDVQITVIERIQLWIETSFFRGSVVLFIIEPLQKNEVRYF